MSLTTSTPTSFRNLDWKTRLKYWLGTLFYHSQFSLDYTVDVLVEPLLQFAECYTRFLGRFFVLGVLGMISLVVFTVHTIGFRFYWEHKSPGLTIVLTMVGYWFLTNVLFNYFSALTRSPGQPEDLEKLRNCLCTICKPCISPKPPRTHHCSVCRKCYLKMDHHCPWVNNCIGHYNHRYFYLTAAYIVTGCGFVMIFGAEIAFKCFFGSEDILVFQRYYYNNNNEERHDLGSVKNNNNNGTGRGDGGSSSGGEISSLGASKLIFLTLLGMPFSTADWESSLETAETVGGIRLSRIGVKILIVLTALVCIGASCLLGGLCWWHGRLISRGETSIEQLINNNKRKMDENYVNIYDLGVRENWRVFLGIDQPGRSFWRHVLLPSMHKPSGDGYDWSHLVRRQGQGAAAVGENTHKMTTENDDTSIFLSLADERTKTE